MTVWCVFYSLWLSLLWVVKVQRPGSCQEWYTKPPKASHLYRFFIFKEIWKHSFATTCLGGKNYSHFIGGGSGGVSDLPGATHRVRCQRETWQGPSLAELIPSPFSLVSFPTWELQIAGEASNNLEQKRNTKSYLFLWLFLQLNPGRFRPKEEAIEPPWDSIFTSVKWE